METRPCGRSGLRLPKLGLGCWAFGGGAYWGPQSQADVDQVVHAALDHGVTYFDTAEGYNDGESERALGVALRGRRDRAFVATKISPGNCRPDALRAHCEASLRRLGTEWIDLYLVHWPINANAIRHFTADAALLRDPPDPAAAFATLADLRRAGKVRHVGVSNFGPVQLAEALAFDLALAANELPYNLLMRGIEPVLLPACTRAGVGVLGYMALMQGVLAGGVASFDDLPASRTRTRHFAGTRPGARHGEPGAEPETWAALQAIAAIAAESGLPMADLALAWALANEAIACTIVGCRNRRQLDANLRAADLTLASADHSRLDAATAPLLAKLGPCVDYYQAAADSRSR